MVHQVISLVFLGCFMEFLGVDELYAKNTSVHGGFALIDEGDDRQRSGMSIHVDSQDFGGRFFYYGRSYGPVTETTNAISIVKFTSLLKSKNWKGSYGLALIRENTKLDFAGDNSSFSRNESSLNFGAHFGIGWQLETKSQITVGAHWESLVFPAGIAGILLATGRKQFLQLTVGVKL